MAEKEAILMKGNEAIAHAAIRCGADGYFGYPITPQSEVLETLAAEKPWETTGMVVLQAESEVAAINMIYGGAQCSSSMFDTGDGNTQISVMRHHKSYIHTRSNWYWLRSVYASTGFAVCGGAGANYSYATVHGGVRPYFLLT